MNNIEPYASAALDGEVARVKAAQEGTRNDTLNVAAFNLGQLVATGALPVAQVERELTDAGLSTGLGAGEVRATLRSGLRAGAGRPRNGKAAAADEVLAYLGRTNGGGGSSRMTFDERWRLADQILAAQTAVDGSTHTRGTTEADSALQDGSAQSHGASDAMGDYVADVLGLLDEDFWDARPYLKHIRDAAHSRQRSAAAVLGVTLARIAACLPHRLRIPPIVGTDAGLSLITVVLAPPGVGKSTASALASELVPAPEGLDLADELPIGSGEGMAETFFGLEDEPDERGKSRKVKRQVRHNAYFYADEGQVLAEIGRRQNAVLLPTIRSAFSGTALGQMNASEERRRVVPAGAYTLGIVVAMQTTLAGALLDDAEGGTPQRCLWMPATDHTIPDQAPAWPGRLDWTPPTREALAAMRADGWLIGEQTYLAVADAVVDEVRAADLARVRGAVAVHALDAHEGLLRLKIAALLAVLDGRLNVNEEDWQLATVIKAASDRTRASVIRTIDAKAAADEAARAARAKERAVSSAVASAIESDSAVAHRRTIDGARWIARKVWADPDHWLVSGLRRAMDSRKRDVFTDALDHAVAEGWVVVASEHGQGADKRAVRPGEQRPP